MSVTLDTSFFVDTLNSAMLIVLLILQDINTTPIELKTGRGCSRRQLFRPIFFFITELKVTVLLSFV